MATQSPQSKASVASRVDSVIASLVVWWVRQVRRLPWLALCVVLLLALGGTWWSLKSFSIRTDTESMLSSHLTFQKNQAEFRKVFPNLGGELVVVIDAADSSKAQAASRTLVAALSKRPDAVAHVVDMEDLPFFRKNGLLYLPLEDLDALSTHLARAQPFLGTFSSDPSLHGFDQLLDLALGNGAPPDELTTVLPNILDRMADVTRALGAAKGDPVPGMVWGDLIGGSKDGGFGSTRRLVLVRPVFDHTGFSPAEAAMQAVRDISGAANLTPASGVTVRLTGDAALAQEELASVESGMLWPSLLSLLSVTALLIIGMQSGRLILAMLSGLAAGLMMTAGFAFTVVGTLNLISVTFAVLFIGLSVDFGLHYGLRYREARVKGLENAAALDEAARSTGTSLVLSALAAMIAFFSFLPTDYIGLAQLGLISGVGMAIALMLNLTLLPAILTLLPLVVRIKGGLPGRWLRWRRTVELYPVRHPRIVGGLALGLALGSLALCFLLRFDTDPLSLKDPKTESMSTLMDVISDPRVMPYTVDVLVKGKTEAERLSARLSALPEVGQVISLLTLVPDQQQEKLEEIENLTYVLGPAFMSPQPVRLDGATLLEARMQVIRHMSLMATEGDDDLSRSARNLAAALEAFPAMPDALSDLDRSLFGGLSAQMDSLREALQVSAPVARRDIPAELRDLYLAADGETYRLQVAPKEDLRGGGPALRAFTDAVVRVAPNAAGVPVVITEAGQTVIGAFLEAALISVVLILALVFLVLRHTRAVVLVFVPVILAGLMTMATAVVIGQSLNLANVIVLPLLVGLGVAGAIHVLGRTEEVRSQGGAVVGSSTPRAVTFSALTTIASFGSLAASSHLGTQSMGILLTLALTYSLFCNLWILPAFIELWPQKATPAPQTDDDDDIRPRRSLPIKD